MVHQGPEKGPLVGEGGWGEVCQVKEKVGGPLDVVLVSQGAAVTPVVSGGVTCGLGGHREIPKEGGNVQLEKVLEGLAKACSGGGGGEVVVSEPIGRD